MDTVMMGAVSVFLTQYRIALYPALAFMTYISFHIARQLHLPGASAVDVLPPLLIACGLVCMHMGRSPEATSWTFTFWFGEALVISIFTYNSLNAIPKKPVVLLAILALGVLSSLWLRGKFWNYVILVGLELLLVLFVAVAFPVMELVLESVLNDKLRRVGDKVRHHHAEMQKYYEAKLAASSSVKR
jgi:hypothetical protein